MKSLLLVLGLVTSSVAVAGSIEGTYKCSGHDSFLSKDYTGTINIIKSKQTYAVTMQFDKGDNLKGTGILSKDGKYIGIIAEETKNNQGQIYSITYFKITGKKLQGQWTYLNSTKVIDETCVREK